VIYQVVVVVVVLWSCPNIRVKTKNATENDKIVFIFLLVIFYRIVVRNRACVGASCLYRF